jgi:hypothetical protein
MSIALRHAYLGGVTQGHTRLGAAFSSLAPKVLPLPAELAPRDASTVLTVKGVVHLYRRAPNSRHTPNYTCENLGTDNKPIYHGGGWLPARIHRGTRVLTPHIYASSGTWENRTLGWDEVMVCYDAPDGVISAFEIHNKLLDRVLFDGITAGKCLKVGFTCLNGGVKS